MWTNLTADQRARVQQAIELARLSGQDVLADEVAANGQSQTAKTLVLLTAFGLDRPEDWLWLDGWDWELILYAHPQLAVKVPDWDVFISNQWARLLSRHPQLIEHLPRGTRLDAVDHEYLQRRRPQLVQHPNWAPPSRAWTIFAKER